MRVATLDLDLEVFQGPFDLLLTLVLEEEVDLLDVDLAEVVLAYMESIERAGELDVEAATEFLVLIAALLELKSRMMLPHAEVELPEPDPGEAVEELLARMLEYRRYSGLAAALHERLAAESRYRYRSARPPARLARAATEVALKAYAPELLARAVGGLLRVPPALDLSHMASPRVTLEQRLGHLRGLLGRGRSLRFEECVAGADRLTEALTVLALLELYRRGEADWTQAEPFGQITVQASQ